MSTPWILLPEVFLGAVMLFNFFFLDLLYLPPLLSPATGLALLAALPVITAWQIVLGEPEAPFTTLLVSMPPVCSNFPLITVPPTLTPHLSLLRTCTSIIHYYTQEEMGQSWYINVLVAQVLTFYVGCALLNKHTDALALTQANTHTHTWIKD